MKAQARNFNKVYTVSYLAKRQAVFNTSTKYYFTGFPSLENFNIKAISATGTYSAAPSEFYITIFDASNTARLTNYPLIDLNQGVNTRLRLFDINGINLPACYFLYSGAPIGLTDDTILFNLHFHY